MKKVAFLLLLLAVPTYAVSLSKTDFVRDISPSDYSQIMCERQKQIGARHDIGKLLCCLNTDHNQYCANNEPLVGVCESGICALPTRTYTPSYATWTRSRPCEGLAIMTGPEFEPLMKKQHCTQTKDYWCCPSDIFPPTDSGLTMRPGSRPPTQDDPNGALLVINPQRWRALELGYYKHDQYLQRALEFEKNRCTNGGGNIRIIDKKYSSYFADTHNMHPGYRAFFLKPQSITALVTWC